MANRADQMPAGSTADLAQIDARIQEAIQAAELQKQASPQSSSSPISLQSPQPSDQYFGSNVPSTVPYPLPATYPSSGMYPVPQQGYAPQPVPAAAAPPPPPPPPQAQPPLMPSQPNYYQFDPAYVQSLPFAYYSSPPMQATYDFHQPAAAPQHMWAAQAAAAASANNAPFPYRPVYVRQPTQDPYQIYDEEGNALANYMPANPQAQPLPTQMQPAFASAQPSSVYPQGFYASGSVTPTPFNLSRTTTTTTSSSGGGGGGGGGGRHSRGFSGFSSSDSIQSTEPSLSPHSGGRTPLHHRPQSQQHPNGAYHSPKTTPVLPNRKQPDAVHQTPMRNPRVKQAASDTLPKPPNHSDFALWVGNVPSDATHAELWTFFTNRPAPPPEPENTDSSANEEVADTGVLSVHLIARTNCCFVNYATQRHLDFALSVNHGVPLRPSDPRARELVCRIRKKEDSSRSGVGAQRSVGIHKTWVWEHEKQRKAQERVEQARINTIEYAAENAAQALTQSTRTSSSEGSEAGGLGRQTAQKSGSTDPSTDSTSSSFLARYFAKRYFILKSSHTQDLEESTRSGFWATQAHNQPVLDEAYTTAREGVFLFFSANGSGAFFGVARMNGPIAKEEPASAPTTSAAAELRPVADTGSAISPRHLVDASPQPFDSNRDAAHEGYLQAARETLRQQRHIHSEPLPAPSEEEETIAERRGASLDTGRLADGIRTLSMQEASPGALAEVAAEAEPDRVPSVTSMPSSAHSMLHRDFIQSPQERNARLEGLPDKTETYGPTIAAAQRTQVLSRGFAVEWISQARVPFARTRNLRNAFNKMKDVKISRDGTELDPVTGETLLSLFLEQTAANPTPGQQ